MSPSNLQPSTRLFSHTEERESSSKGCMEPQCLSRNFLRDTHSRSLSQIFLSSSTFSTGLRTGATNPCLFILLPLLTPYHQQTLLKTSFFNMQRTLLLKFHQFLGAEKDQEMIGIRLENHFFPNCKQQKPILLKNFPSEKRLTVPKMGLQEDTFEKTFIKFTVRPAINKLF